MPDGLDDLLGTDSASGDGQSSGGQLRKQLEAVLEQNRLLTERLTKQETVQRENALASLFGKHSIPELAKDLFPKDAEPTDEAATALIEKYGGLWGASATTATTTAADQAATTAAQQFAAQAGPATGAMPQSEDEARAYFAQAKTKEEFERLMSEAEAALAAAGT